MLRDARRNRRLSSLQCTQSLLSEPPHQAQCVCMCVYVGYTGLRCNPDMNHIPVGLVSITVLCKNYCKVRRGLFVRGPPVNGSGPHNICVSVTHAC